MFVTETNSTSTCLSCQSLCHGTVNLDVSQIGGLNRSKKSDNNSDREKLCITRISKKTNTKSFVCLLAVQTPQIHQDPPNTTSPLTVYQ